MARRQIPASSTSRRAKAEGAAGRPAEEIIREQEPGRQLRAKTQPDGRRGILVRLPPEVWRALKQLALDEDTTLQAVMEEAASLRLRKSGKLPRG